MYQKRIRILVVVICVALATLGVRVGVLQILRADTYRRRAQGLLRYKELLPAARGRILDRRGKILAYDRPCFDLCLDYRLLTEEARWLRRRREEIARARRVSESRAEEILRERIEATWRLVEGASHRSREEIQETVVARIIERVQGWRTARGGDVREQNQAHAVVSGLLDPPPRGDDVGVVIRPSTQRWYPLGVQACHIIGLTGEVSKKEQEALNVADPDADWVEHLRRDYRGGDCIGKSGVEKLYEPVLRGRRGYREFRRAGVLDHEVPVDHGRDVHLTIDIALQERLAELVPEERKGCVIVLSVPRGEVLAMVSTPMYDLNRYRRDFIDLADDVVDLPLRHRAVQERYPPGSTLKPIAAIAALSEGVIDGATTHICYGSLFPGGRGPDCWNRAGHGPVTVREAIMQSCNVFFYHVGEDTGIPRLGRWFREFGLADLPGTGLPEEVAGSVPTDGSKGESRFLAIGQGPIGVTPLHVANLAATIARDGEFRSPTIALEALEGAPTQTRRMVPAPQDAIRLVQGGMYDVANNPASRTAYKYFHGSGVEPLGVEVCGKTGTAQTSKRLVDTDDGRLVIEGNTVWFMGFAPAQDPRVAFAVMLERVSSEEGGGARNCGPIAREVVRWCGRFGYLR
jgi:penicillin-binding protein 2